MSTSQNISLNNDLKKRPTILYIFNVSWFFQSHRLSLAKSLIDQGYKIHLASKFVRKDKLAFKEAFIDTHDIDFSRSRLNIINEIKVFFSIIRVINRVKPDIIEVATLKPVIFTGVICMFSKVKLVVWITGLGYVFINKSRKGQRIKKFVLFIYKIIFSKKAISIIFENHDDLKSFIRFGIVKKNKAKLIRGAGVNIKQFPFSEEPPRKPIIVVLPARMLFDKGVSNYIEAAKIVKRKYGDDVHFHLIGGVDEGNPASIPIGQIKQWQKDKIVNWLGHSNNMLDIFTKSHIICLPSYREGLPKALLEASSVGRPLVAFNAPGCKEIVKHNYNGIIVPLKDNVALAHALIQLIEDKSLRLKMGKRGRGLVEEFFEESIIFKKTISVYKNESFDDDN